MIQKRWLGIAAVSGFLAVALGAFGSHRLQAQLTPADLSVWQTAVQYQMFHTLALLAVSLLAGSIGRRSALWAGSLFTVGIVLFSGSLYVLVLGDLRWLGVITPIGGLAFMVGWLWLLVAALRSRRRL